MCLHMLYLAKSTGCYPKQSPLFVTSTCKQILIELHCTDEVRKKEIERKKKQERERERGKERERDRERETEIKRE